MAESGTPAATSAFAAARDGVRAIGDRLEALGPGSDALIEALAGRLGALPASVDYMPFGDLGALTQALAGPSPPISNKARPPRGSGLRNAPPKTEAPRAQSRTGADSRAPDIQATLGAALVGGVAKAGAKPDLGLAGSLLVEPVINAMATLARLTQQAPPKQAGGDSPLAASAAIAQHVARWLAGQVEQAAAPTPASGRAPFGSAIGDLRSSEELISRALASLGGRVGVGALPSADGAVKASPSKRPERQTADRRTSPTEPAPRARSKLLAPKPASTRDPSTPAADRIVEMTDVATPSFTDDPLEAMMRALVDQAWLRGVDLR
ncbi:MAG: hypothetical protein ABIO45_01795 [Burkholderiaceae bacterium]